MQLLLCVGVNYRLSNAAFIHFTAVVQPACLHHINEHTGQLGKQQLRFLVMWRPLVVIVIIMAAKEENATEAFVVNVPENLHIKV